jgi:nucleoside-diphosphate-sugar epimerase
MDELHVVFGTGPLGLAVMRELVARGKKVRLVNRRGSAQVPAGVEMVRADVSVPGEARQAAGRATVVYQCANAPYTQWQTQLAPLVNNVMEAAAAANARLVVGDNLYMYGKVRGRMTEDLPNAPVSKKGRVRAELSEMLLRAHRSGKVRVTIGRGSDFFGPHVMDSVMGGRVFPRLLAGRKVAGYGDIDLPHTYTFINDFGKALAVLGANDLALGQIWHVPNAGTVTTRQFLTMACETAGQKPRIGAMGTTMLRLAGLFIPPAREMVEMMYEFEQPFEVDHSKYARAFGDHATPLPEALRRTLDWYSRN